METLHIDFGLIGSKYLYDMNDQEKSVFNKINNILSYDKFIFETQNEYSSFDELIHNLIIQ
jgi:hypothetical protein